MDALDALALLLIAITHFIGGIATFGSSLLAVPALLMIYGPDTLPRVVLLMVVVGLSQCVWLAWRNHHATDRRLGLAMLLGSALGVPVGFTLVNRLPGTAILLLLGALTLAAGITGLLSPPRQTHAPNRRLRRAALPVSALAGVVHGAFASGGTVLVAYVQRVLPDRDAFRATLSVYWLLLNAGFVAALLIKTPPGPRDLLTGAGVTALVLVTTALADRAAKRLNPQAFQRGVSILLLVTGMLILLTQAF